MPEIGTSGSMSGMWKRSMVRIVRHRQTKGPATDRPNLTHRATSRLHHLDSTSHPSRVSIQHAWFVALSDIFLLVPSLANRAYIPTPEALYADWCTCSRLFKGRRSGPCIF